MLIERPVKSPRSPLLINDDPLDVTRGRDVGWGGEGPRFTREIRLPFAGFSGIQRGTWIRDGCTVYTPGRFHGVENLAGPLCRLLPFQVSVKSTCKAGSSWPLSPRQDATGRL